MSLESISSSPQGDVARAALKVAFGARPIEALSPIVGGITTALALRVQVGGRGYLLRAEGEPSPLRNPHQYESMRIAAEAGVAPRIRYLDEAARVVVMDFIEQRPLYDYPGGFPGLAHGLGELLKHLQTAPVFAHFVDYPDIAGSCDAEAGTFFNETHDRTECRCKQTSMPLRFRSGRQSLPMPRRRFRLLQSGPWSHSRFDPF